MEKSNHHHAYIAELMTALNDDGMSLLDFDRLKTWLAEIEPRLGASPAMQSELEQLRQDYFGRIGGMIKAIAVADRKGNRYESALALIESLPGMTATELVDCYRRTCARFRDCFPASFVGHLGFRPRVGRSKEFADYK